MKGVLEMRPVHLSVSGLHSFRDKQDVDFQSLCKGGVFGIFGPTGSGKSSLLDAVTLSLYGKVERAANTIQGIMNHAEDQLNVSFTFELGEGVNAKRYKVDRTYKRQKGDSIRTSTCRLIEVVNEEHVVLADKERDVTSGVEQILGLTLTDFTRAVVLPQGKFAEFLSLKGAERRQMLQRLFRLEQYGDLLNQRLKRKVEDTNMVLKEIVAEQQGLGEASKETIKELEVRLEEAMKLVEDRNGQLNKKEIQFEHYRQIWKWQEELNEVKEKVMLIQMNEPKIKQLQERLKSAQEADALYPYVQELEELLIDQKHWTKKKIELDQQTEQSRKKVKHALEDFQSIRKYRTEQEPTLYERLQDLKQAKELEQERNQLNDHLQQEKRKLDQQKEELLQAEKELDKLQEQKKKALKKQAEIKQEIEEKTVTFDERNHLREAVNLKKEIQSKIKIQTELQTDQKKITEHLTKIQAEVDKQTIQQKKVKENIGYLLQHTETIYNRVCEHERVIERAKNGIERSLEDTRQKQHDLELHLLSVKIAKQLKAGDKCPVCGSLEHPELAVGVSNDQDYTDLVGDLDRILTEVKEEEIAISHCKKDLEFLFETLEDYIRKEELSGDEIAAASFDPIENTLQSTEDLKRYLTLLKTETKGFKQDLIELREKKTKYINSFSKYDKQVLENNTSLTTDRREVGRIEEKLKEVGQAIQTYRDEWRKSFDTIPYENIEELQKKMDDQEREVSNLNGRYDKSITFLYELDETITKVSENVQSQKLNVSSQSSDINSSDRRLNELKSWIVERCGKEKADDLIQFVQSEMEELKHKEHSLQQLSETESSKLQDLEKELEVAKSTVLQTEERLKKGQSKWENKIQQTTFKTKDEVKESLISHQQQVDWEKEIESFQEERQQHFHNQSRLLDLLNNKEVSESEWNKVQDELKESKHAKELALSEKARLEGEVDEMKKRAVKYDRLEKRKLEYEERAERLGRLQTVFRGNSFVEFIAEEQLNQVARDASQRLGELTRQRYALEVDSTGGFVIRDDANGGVRRPVTSLSGGETFLTSLALALSLSAQIQLQGEYPLEFFFLDEGFGTLDQSLLDTVISALERLQMQQVSVGVISHVPELRARLPRKLIVDPATPAGKGSTVSIETL
jgi:exonuclease SbcC